MHHHHIITSICTCGERERGGGGGPGSVTPGGVTDATLALFLLVLEVAATLDFVDDTRPHNVSPESIEKKLIGLVLVHLHLHVVSRFVVHRVRVSQRRADHRHHIA